jgi:hypothetical protein
MSSSVAGPRASVIFRVSGAWEVLSAGTDGGDGIASLMGAGAGVGASAAMGWAVVLFGILDSTGCGACSDGVCSIALSSTGLLVDVASFAPSMEPGASAPEDAMAAYRYSSANSSSRRMRERLPDVLEPSVPAACICDMRLHSRQDPLARPQGSRRHKSRGR